MDEHDWEILKIAGTAVGLIALYFVGLTVVVYTVVKVVKVAWGG